MLLLLDHLHTFLLGGCSHRCIHLDWCRQVADDAFYQFQHFNYSVRVKITDEVSCLSWPSYVSFLVVVQCMHSLFQWFVLEQADRAHRCNCDRCPIGCSRSKAFYDRYPRFFASQNLVSSSGVILGFGPCFFVLVLWWAVFCFVPCWSFERCHLPCFANQCDRSNLKRRQKS